MNNPETNKEILFMKPVFKQVIWGGDRLGREWGYDIPGSNTGECWAVSAHQNGDCVVREGTFAGKTLSCIWAEHPQLFGSTGGDRFPLLVKIIDANDDLSIQVHPDDDYAKENGNGSAGKTECWYILDAPEGASLVIGHNARDKAELRDMVYCRKWDELLREVPVRKGDFIQIDPGTVHAIKGGIELLETQQNSDITYRVYDYDRLQDGRPRELHIDRALDVITAPSKSVRESIVNAGQSPQNVMYPLISCDHYQVWRLDVDGEMGITQEYPFLIMSVVEGDGRIDGQAVRKGDHFILPAGYGEAVLCGRMVLIASTMQK